MKKIFALTCSAYIVAGAAFAGNLVFEAPVEEEVMVEEAAPMGGSNAAWIVPLIAIGVIAIALTGGDDEDCQGSECQD